ncbi:MAG TPA: hypothetical protein VK324_14620, partial [Tepidisphaeraceae bacterium]|nr:hypothetical protein [Tepidisphaeraceae bacterium]
KYYPPGHWGQRLDEQELTAVFVGEIGQGIDGNDLAGPEVRRTPHRAGLIKIAGGRDRLTEPELRLFCAAAAAHVATGCPILTHTEEGTAALEQVEVLRDAGADLRHVVLSHLDRRPDLTYHREILSTGVRLEYDSAFRWKPGQGNPTLDLVVALIGDFPDQILLGMDAARSRYWASFGGAPGLAFLLRDFVPQLRAADLSRRDVDRILIDNPAAAYSFAAIRSTP